ncbi:MAG: alpha/beta fold hydrolase [Myxococcota bacterium]
MASLSCSGETTSTGFVPAGVIISAEDPPVAERPPAAPSSTPSQGPSSTRPEPGLGAPYPIVLAHGFFGFDEFAGLDFATYFFEVQEHLTDRGEFYVFTPAVDPFNDSSSRGFQLADAIEEIRALTGYEKVNLIGHSQGGLDARVVAHDHPEWVASVTTLQTPHGGTRISDIALQIVSDPNLQEVLDWLVQLVGAGLYEEIDGDTSISDALAQFSGPEMERFNAAYPDHPDVFYASIAGRSDGHRGGTDCQTEDAPGFVTRWADETDPIDPLFAVSEALLDGGFGDPYPNDGLVRVRDARWGTFLGCLPADHMDMVGHLLGDDPGRRNDWEHKQFYVDLIRYLRSRGL